MTGLLRLTLDTNVLVSALITAETPPDLLYRAWRDGMFLLVTSGEQIDELRRVLAYPKLKPYIDALSARELISGLPFDAILASDLPTVSYSRDPADNIILATALKGQSDFLVTGDKKDLLALDKIGSLAIVTAKTAIGILEDAGRIFG